MNSFQLATVLGSFLFVYVLVVLRGTRKLSLSVWISMAIGASFLIESGTITPTQALRAVDFRVLGFLFGMFTVVTAMELSGLLETIARKMLTLSTTPNKTIFTTLFGAGLLSSVLVNDTIALLWTPVVIGIAAGLDIEATPLLIALAFGITIGSTMTPIGNPQNLLVAENSRLPSPMVTFLGYLGVPTIVNLILAAVVVSLFYSKRIRKSDSASFNYLTTVNAAKHNNDPKLSRISIFGIVVAVTGFLLASFVNIDLLGPQTSLTFVALLSGGVVYLLSSRRKQILLHLDWSILAFFSSMFILMSAVWDSGVGPAILQFFGEPSPTNQTSSITIIMSLSTVLSQILSNVPFVQLYSRVLIAHNVGGSFPKLWLALAAGSTIAGNLTILGAASNIIIVEAAEKRGVRAFSFFQFLKIGAIVTGINLLVYSLFLVFL